MSKKCIYCNNRHVGCHDNCEDYFRLDWTTLSWYWQQYQSNRVKRGFGSIPINEFECNCKQLKSRDGIILDYLEGIENGKEITNN